MMNGKRIIVHMLIKGKVKKVTYSHLNEKKKNKYKKLKEEKCKQSRL